MPRSSSRHKSHRSSQKNKGRWDVLPEPLERRGNAGEESGKKGIERDAEVSCGVSDRWTGDVDEGNVEGLEVKVEMEVDVEKIEKVKSSQSKSKYGSGRRREGSEERKAEKELVRRESSGGKDSNVKDRESGLGKSKDCGQVKERGRGEMKKERERDREKEGDRDRDREKEYRSNKEREPERHRTVDSHREKLADLPHRNSQIGSADGKYPLKCDAENNERQSQNELPKPVHDKDLGKQTRRDVSAEKYKCIGSGIDNSDRKLYSTDDRGRNGGYKEQRYKDGKYRENYQEDAERDQKHQDDKRHGSVRSENKYRGNEIQILEMHNGSRVKDIDHESSGYVDKHNVEIKVNKKSSDENEVYNNVKHNNASLLQTDEVQKKIDNYKFDIDHDRRRSDPLRSGRVDSTIRQNHQKKSLPSNLTVVKDEERSLSKERHHTSSASSGDLAGVSGATGRSLKSQSVESMVKRKDIVHHDDMKAEESAISRYARLDGHTSATTYVDQQYSRKRSGSRGYDVEETRQKRSYSKDGRETPDDGPTRVGSLSSTRSNHFPGSSPGHILPHPPVRYGADVSVLGSFEENNRNQAGDRKSNNQYRRSGDSNMSRGQANAWKGNWSSQSANRFVAYQHGPSPGFHPAVHPFPSPSMFGVRPFIDINHPVPFHMQDNPFAWQNPSDSCPPHFQGWHGRPDWEQSRHYVGGNRGWDVDGNFLNDQNVSQKSEFFASHNEHNLSKQSQEDDTQREQASQLLQNGQNQFKRNETLQRNDSDLKSCIENLAKGDAEMPNNKRRKIFESANSSSNDNGANFCRTYLSKVNVSLGLVHRELYKKFITVAGTGDVTDQDANKGINTTIWSNRDARNPLFPPLSENVFKKAFVLYKKANEGSNTKFSSSIFQLKDGVDSHKSLEEAKNYQEESHVSDEEGNSMENATTHKEESKSEDYDAAAGRKRPSENSGKESDLIPSAVIWSVESSSLGCEDLKKPACLSRIH